MHAYFKCAAQRGNLVMTWNVMSSFVNTWTEPWPILAFHPKWMAYFSKKNEINAGLK